MAGQELLRGLDLEAAHDFATQLAVRAGAMLRENAWKRACAPHLSSSASSADPISHDQSYAAEKLHENGALNTREKDSSVDVVTDIDLSVERFVVEEIRKVYPGFDVLAEEAYAAGGSKRYACSELPTWIVDPLDGTVNFTHLFPTVCVSIGLAIGNEPVCGAIYAPLMGAGANLDPVSHLGGMLWSACKGHGAFQSTPDRRHPQTSTLQWLKANIVGSTMPSTADSKRTAGLDGHPRPLRLPINSAPLLRTSSPQIASSTLKGLLLISEWGKDRRPPSDPQSNLTRKANTFWNLTKRSTADEAGQQGGEVHGIRSLGSAALDLVYCASGSVDIMWEGGCWEWDVCAGLAILAEAGGLWTDGNAPSPASALWREDTPLPRGSLGGRRFLCIRPEATPNESTRLAQERIARAVWRNLHHGGLQYEREGVVYPS